jgi:geranylgeranyl pyrophosphate synthase
LLPGLCCHAAGGDPRDADEFSAAWLLYYLAAHIMDHVEDQDAPEEWWQGSSPGVAINVASGLYFTASLLLAGLHEKEQTRGFAGELIREFYNGFLVMCSGQGRELTQPEPSLAQYWEDTQARSGVFFSMACRLGARLALAEGEKLHHYGEFGRQVGILIQILDDLEEYQRSSGKLIRQPYKVLRRSLPVIYALDVLPSQDAARLRQSLQDALQDDLAAEQAYRIIEESGVVVYLLAEIDRHSALARESLDKASPLPQAAREIYSLLDQIAPRAE